MPVPDASLVGAKPTQSVGADHSCVSQGFATNVKHRKTARTGQRRDQPGHAVGQDMVKHGALCKMVLVGGMLLSACAPGQNAGPAQADLAIELVRLSRPGPPQGPDGACWASDTTPAIIETVTEQVVIGEEVRDAAGAVITPATFETQTFQRMVQDREEVWFRAPCAADMTVAFVATLQRALKARGIYLQPVTGVLDAATADAIRRFQATRGLDSPTLSLAAAKELGISATDRDDL